MFSNIFILGMEIWSAFYDNAYNETTPKIIQATFSADIVKKIATHDNNLNMSKVIVAILFLTVPVYGNSIWSICNCGYYDPKLKLHWPDFWQK